MARPKALLMAMALLLGLPAAGQSPSPAPAPSPEAPTPTPTASAASIANMRWEGLVRRNAGFVLRSRWDVGILEFRQETVRWTDARDPGKNLLIPAARIKEQFSTCAKTPEGPACFEWGFKTAEATFTFRDFGWEKGAHEKVAEIYGFFQAIYPTLPLSQAFGTR